LATANFINQEDSVGCVYHPQGLPLNLAHGSAKEESAPSKANIEPLRLVEKRAILTAVDLCNGNIPQAAGLLEISPSTLYRKLQFWQQDD
ncbi:MAG: helix-turn-helix domain-containing protein, partial [Vibrionaceae bacterium]